MVAWNKKEEEAVRHRQEKREATRLGNLLTHTEAQNFEKQRPLMWSTSRRNPCTDARRTETCVAPVDASLDFLFYFSERAAWGVRGGGGG